MHDYRKYLFNHQYLFNYQCKFNPRRKYHRSLADGSLIISDSLIINGSFIINRYLRYLCIMIFFGASCCAADIYKWTDAAGKIHYSDRKANAGKSKAEEVNVKSALNLMDEVKASENSSDDGQDQTNEQSRKLPAKTKAINGTDNNDSVDFRCTLARRIINGEVELSNGLPVGEHEIEMAKRDIAKFCN